MFLVRCLVLLQCFEIVVGQFTKKENKILSRKKRYLSFPEGSNLVMTGSYVKALMKDVPKGINVLGEMDVPFPLPSDTRWYKKHKGVHYRQRRELFNQFEDAFNEYVGNHDRYGLNGNACVKRMICEAQQFVPSKGKSLVRDLLSAIFMPPEFDEKFRDFCHKSIYEDCTFSLLHFIIGSLTNN